MVFTRAWRNGRFLGADLGGGAESRGGLRVRQETSAARRDVITELAYSEAPRWPRRKSNRRSSCKSTESLDLHLGPVAFVQRLSEWPPPHGVVWLVPPIAKNGNT